MMYLEMDENYNRFTRNDKSESLAAPQRVNDLLRRTSFEKTKSSLPQMLNHRTDNRILNKLPPTVLCDLLPLMQIIELSADLFIYHPGERQNFFFFPETAIISEFQILEDGKTMEVAMIGSEGFIGMQSLFKPCAAPNFSQVLKAGTVRCISADILRCEISRSEIFGELTFDFINRYIARISRNVICSNYHSIEKRLCRRLLMLDDRCGAKQTLFFSQEQIARSLGVRRPTVSLILQSLREKHILDYTRGKIAILDRDKLERYSCVCYSAN